MNFQKKAFKIGKLRFCYTVIHKVIHRFCGWKTAKNRKFKIARFILIYFNHFLLYVLAIFITETNIKLKLFTCKRLDFK